MDHEWPTPNGSSNKEALVKCRRCGASLKLSPAFKDVDGMMTRKIEELDLRASQPCAVGRRQ